MTILACGCSCGASHLRGDGGADGPRADGGGIDAGRLDAGRLDAGRLDVGPRDAGTDASVFWPRCEATSPCQPPPGVTLLGSMGETFDLPAGMYATDGRTGCASIVVRPAPDGGLDIQLVMQGPGWSITPPSGSVFSCTEGRECWIRGVRAGEHVFEVWSCGFAGRCYGIRSELLVIDPSLGFVRRESGAERLECGGVEDCQDCP